MCGLEPFFLGPGGPAQERRTHTVPVEGEGHGGEGWGSSSFFITHVLPGYVCERPNSRTSD